MKKEIKEIQKDLIIKNKQEFKELKSECASKEDALKLAEMYARRSTQNQIKFEASLVAMKQIEDRAKDILKSIK